MKERFIIAIIVAVVLTLIIKRKSVMELSKQLYDKLTRSQYVNTFKDAVIKASKGTSLFPSVAMAQGILESNNGNSGLAKKANNHFGIKADESWRGKKMNFPTREVINGKDVMIDAYFRAYDNPVDSFIDHVRFLKSFKRYNNVFTAKTPEQQAVEIQKAGYATDPNYAKLLISIINSNNLKSLDT